MQAHFDKTEESKSLGEDGKLEMTKELQDEIRQNMVNTIHKQVSDFQEVITNAMIATAQSIEVGLTSKLGSKLYRNLGLG